MFKRLKPFLFTFFLVNISEASEWSYGFKAGFGGTGIKKTVSIDEGNVDASKSEGPAIFGVSAERALSNKWNLSIEHRRGFRFGPFSSGVGFTDVTWRWYYLGSVPPIVSNETVSFVFTKKWVPFLGISAGVAFGSITREGDKVARVKSSGAILGTKIGVDYHYKKDVIMRPELIVSSTFMNAGAIEESMSEFGLMYGMIFSYP